MVLTGEAGPLNMRPVLTDGAIAQLGERLHGMQEVDGSIPSSSTKFRFRLRGKSVEGFVPFV